MGKELLNWWLSFAQTDLERAYNKTKLRLHDELERKLQTGSGMCPWHAESFRLDVMREFQVGAMEIVRALQDSSLKRPEGAYTVQVRMESLTACKWVSTSRDRKETAKALMLEALQKANLESAEQLGNCKTCGNLFLQVSPKRKKLFCRTQCKTKFYKEGKNGSNNAKT